MRLQHSSGKNRTVGLNWANFMTTAERLRHEQLFHDNQARERAEFLHARSNSLRVNDGYLDHESWIRPALESFGNLRGKRVLDFGCGHGMAAIVLARRGAQVTAFDLSGGYLNEARRRAEVNGVTVSFARANGEALPFSDHSFDH